MHVQIIVDSLSHLDRHYEILHMTAFDDGQVNLDACHEQGI